MSGKKYTTSQKLAYYKKLAQQKPTKTRYTGRGAYKRTRTRPRYTGRGAYKEKQEGYGAIGSRIGRNIGKGLGELGGEVVKFFTGRGAYEVKNNSLLENGGGDESTMPPIVNKIDKPGSVIIRKSEYITDVISGTAGTFNNTTYSINPGLMNTFQWLSQVATNFEEYEICGMYFEFRSMSVDALNSTNTALGQVVMAVDYNASNPAFTSKQQMENYEGAVSVKPSQSVRFFVECARQLNVLTSLYVRGGAVPTDDDVRLYDLGTLNVATNGLQASTVNLGELWVCYEVCLWKSRLYSALGFDIDWFAASSTTWTNALPLTGFTSGTRECTLGVTIATNNTIVFPQISAPQSYSVYIEWHGTVAAAITFPVITYTNCTASSQSIPTAADVAKGCMYNIIIDTTANTIPTMAFGAAGSLPTTPAGGTIWISKVSNLFEV